MRIVHLTQSTTSEITGGLEHHIAYLSEALRRRGHEIIVVSTASLTRSAPPGAEATPARPGRGRTILPAAVRQRLEVLLETVSMFARRCLRLRHASRVAAHVDSLHPDLVHQHAYLGELRACWLILRRYPLVFTNHTGAYLHLDRWAVTRVLQRRWMRRFTMTIGPSCELVPALENSRYVPNGVDTEVFFPRSAPEIAALKARHGCLDKHVFVCPRRWAPTKGIIYLARALRCLSPAARQNSVFLFAGNETPGYARYQQGVRAELAVSGCDVRVLGNLGHAELAELLNIATACIIPSLMEATSLACLEAMACATPVVGTRTGGLLELIRDGENGWLVPMRDEKALAARIDQVVAAEPGSLQLLALNTVGLVRARYTWDIAARETEEVYRLALEKGVRSRGGHRRTPSSKRV